MSVLHTPQFYHAAFARLRPPSPCRMQYSSPEDRAHGRDARQHAELANSWWHCVISLDRALERERMEFKDGCLIAADIAFRASGKNPLSWHQTFDVPTSCSTGRP
jgi:hypothetical protein